MKSAQKVTCFTCDYPVYAVSPGAWHWGSTELTTYPIRGISQWIIYV